MLKFVYDTVFIKLEDLQTTKLKLLILVEYLPDVNFMIDKMICKLLIYIYILLNMTLMYNVSLVRLIRPTCASRAMRARRARPQIWGGDSRKSLLYKLPNGFSLIIS